MNFSTLSIKIKIVLAVFTPIAVLLGVGIYSWYRVSKSGGAHYLEFSLAAAAILGVFGILVSRSVLRSLSILTLTVEEVIESSNFSKRVVNIQDDEIGGVGKAVNRLIAHFEHMVNQLSTVSDSLAQAAETMSGVSNQTSRDIQRQLSETEQAATAMNEMSSTVAEVARNATEASTAAKEADKQASKGSKVVSEVIVAIKELAQEVQTTADVIHTVENETKSIGSVLDVIRGIAEQTNLLALNAAIEAARAGEQGRGFAVVADEVRTLASRTQQSTQEIQKMIERLQNGVQNAVVAMGRGQEKAQGSVAKAESAGCSLDEINKAVTTITAMNMQIASASEEQSLVAEKINRNVSAIQEISSLSSQGSAKVTTTSGELSELARGLQNIVRKFHA